MAKRGRKTQGVGASAPAPLLHGDINQIAANIIDDSQIDYVYHVKEDGQLVEKKGTYTKSQLEDVINAFVQRYPACQVKWRDSVLLVCNKYTNSLKTINIHNPLDVVKSRLNNAHGSMFDVSVDTGGIDKALALAYANAESKGQVVQEAQRVLSHNVGAGFGWYTQQFERSEGKLYQA